MCLFACSAYRFYPSSVHICPDPFFLIDARIKRFLSFTKIRCPSPPSPSPLNNTTTPFVNQPHTLPSLLCTLPSLPHTLLSLTLTLPSLTHTLPSLLYAHTLPTTFISHTLSSLPHTLPSLPHFCSTTEWVVCAVQAARVIQKSYRGFKQSKNENTSAIHANMVRRNNLLTFF